MKAIYRHKQSGDIFSIETNEAGQIISTSGPLFGDDIDPKMLDDDKYWNTEIAAKLDDFNRITKIDYTELLRKYGFYPQIAQRRFLQPLSVITNMSSQIFWFVFTGGWAGLSEITRQKVL